VRQSSSVERGWRRCKLPTCRRGGRGLSTVEGSSVPGRVQAGAAVRHASGRLVLLAAAPFCFSRPFDRPDSRGRPPAACGRFRARQRRTLNDRPTLPPYTRPFADHRSSITPEDPARTDRREGRRLDARILTSSLPPDHHPTRPACCSLDPRSSRSSSSSPPSPPSPPPSPSSEGSSAASSAVWSPTSSRSAPRVASCRRSFASSTRRAARRPRRQREPQASDSPASSRPLSARSRASACSRAQPTSSSTRRASAGSRRWPRPPGPACQSLADPPLILTGFAVADSRDSLLLATK